MRRSFRRSPASRRSASLSAPWADAAAARARELRAVRYDRDAASGRSRAAHISAKSRHPALTRKQNRFLSGPAGGEAAGPADPAGNAYPAS